MICPGNDRPPVSGGVQPSQNATPGRGSGGWKPRLPHHAQRRTSRRTRGRGGRQGLDRKFARRNDLGETTAASVLAIWVNDTMLVIFPTLRSRPGGSRRCLHILSSRTKPRCFTWNRSVRGRLERVTAREEAEPIASQADDFAGNLAEGQRKNACHRQAKKRFFSVGHPSGRCPVKREFQGGYACQTAEVDALASEATQKSRVDGALMLRRS